MCKGTPIQDAAQAAVIPSHGISDITMLIAIHNKYPHEAPRATAASCSATQHARGQASLAALHRPSQRLRQCCGRGREEAKESRQVEAAAG